MYNMDCSSEFKEILKGRPRDEGEQNFWNPSIHSSDKSAKRDHEKVGGIGERNPIHLPATMRQSQPPPQSVSQSVSQSPSVVLPRRVGAAASRNGNCKETEPLYLRTWNFIVFR